jgi:hypothetical protein
LSIAAIDVASVARDAADMPLWVKIVVALIVGLLLGFVILAAGVMVGGLGHGWVTPLWFSFAGPVICPIVAFRLLNFADRWLGFDIALLVGGVLIDFIIYNMTIEEGVHYFHRVGEFAYVWIGLWSLWQAALLIKLIAVAFQRKTGRPKAPS